MSDRLSAAKSKHIRSLFQRKYRQRYRESIVEGLRSVEAYTDSGNLVKDLVIDESLRESGSLARIRKNTKGSVYSVDARDIEDLSGVETAPGIIAVVELPASVELEDIDSQRVLVSDAIQDPGNLGAMIRSAAWFGFTDLVLGKGTVDPYSPKVIRASMGGIWACRLSESVSLSLAHPALVDSGYTFVVADLEGQSPDRVLNEQKLALVVGNEANGVDQELKKKADYTIAIPRSGKGLNPESLNVTVAASILMSQLTI